MVVDSANDSEFSIGDHGDEDQHTMKILIATDCHLGYMEKDPLRSLDSFKTFEEILIRAEEHEVDCILLGGDLFHDNKPSRETMFRTMELLRRYCMGGRPCTLELLSDQSENFKRFKTVNYEDPNYNISLPIFTIHGNHDDPAGTSQLCALDLLSAANLINYFGNAMSIDNIHVSPLLFGKGNTRLALYGLGNIRDERLHQTFLKRKVKMLTPTEDEEWFSLFVLHQNRVKHGPTNYIPEDFLPDFLDLVMWGHEHECLIEPTPCASGEFLVSQPGSSVATALSDGESKKKHIGILKIKGKKHEITPIPLCTVRPFLIKDIVLSEQPELNPNNQEQVIEYIKSEVEELLQQATEMVEDADNVAELKNPIEPLIRVRVEYSGGFTPFNVQRFGQCFVSKVANPKDILLFYRKRAVNQTSGDTKKAQKEAAAAVERSMQLDAARVEDLVHKALMKGDNLKLLSESGMAKAVASFVEKDEKDAIKTIVSHYLDQYKKFIKKSGGDGSIEANEIDEMIQQHRKKEIEKDAVSYRSPSPPKDAVLSQASERRGSVRKDKPTTIRRDIESPPAATKEKRTDLAVVSDEDEEMFPVKSSRNALFPLQTNPSQKEGEPSKSTRTSRPSKRKADSSAKGTTRKSSRQTKLAVKPATSSITIGSDDDDDDECDNAFSAKVAPKTTSTRRTRRKN
eukprot:Nk52_evm11s298 gene=Nk52_evmTU11s298